MCAHELVSLNFQNRAGFEKCLHPVSSIFTADTRVFESSPGCLWIIRHAIDHHAPGSYLRGYATRAFEVGPEHGGVQTIFGIIGDADRLFLCVISYDTKDGAKNLFLCDCHIVSYVSGNVGLTK